MGVNTTGYTNKNIEAKEIYDVIVDCFDKEAVFNIELSKYDGKELGFIYFQDGEDKRQLFYCITKDRENLFNDEHVCLSLGYWGNSVNIMVEILNKFGGYVDENDCDDIDEIYIPQNNDFQFSEYIHLRNKIIDCLDDSLSTKEKVKIANQIIKNKEQIILVLL